MSGRRGTHVDGRPWLSWLYVPGDRPERFDKAVASGASVVILDLEDAVSPAHKDAARSHVVAYLNERSSGPTPLHVRVNGLGTAWVDDDLTALAGDGAGAAAHPDGIRVPKVESVDDLDRVALAVGPSMPLYAIVESARGLRSVDAIAAHPAVAGVALGEQDLLAELGVTAPAAVDAMRLQVVLAAAAAGKGPVPMSVFPRIRDDAGFLETSRAGRALGMVGRSVIHPAQVALTRQAFRPDQGEIDWATDVVATAGDDDAPGATSTADGQFVDAPVLARARALLALADATIEPDPS